MIDRLLLHVGHRLTSRRQFLFRALPSTRSRVMLALITGRSARRQWSGEKERGAYFAGWDTCEWNSCTAVEALCAPTARRAQTRHVLRRAILAVCNRQRIAGGGHTTVVSVA